MLPAENSVCGLIEFEPAEAHLTLRTHFGNDETMHETLLSLAKDLLAGSPESDGLEWFSESVVVADIESLEHDLLLIYHKIVRTYPYRN